MRKNLISLLLLSALPFGKIEMPKHFQRVRCLIVGRRVYMVAALGPKDFVTSADADKVLESFEVTK